MRRAAHGYDSPIGATHAHPRTFCAITKSRSGPTLKNAAVRRKKVSAITLTRLKVIKINAKPQIRLKRQSESDKHQENLAIILSHSNATPIRSKSSTGYTCCFCPNEYPEASDLKTHTLENHEASKSTYMKGHPMPKFLVKLDITSLRCSICGLNCDTLGDLSQHLTTNHNKQFYAKLKNYIVPFRFDTEVLECVECRQQFNNFKVLLEHMNSHYRNHVCDICGEGFVNKRIMLTHWYRHKKGVFSCGHCEKTFDNNVKQKEHERAVHVNSNKRYKCGYCGEKFTDYTKKNDHVVKAHGAKPLVLNCQACNRTFDNQRALTVHTKSYHLLEGRLKKAGGYL
ncbi:hypothetical protein evm_012897 [Chilo suppressalis]|nr:hypothetical protein evm_012897 [Chilo suppressalis]